MIRIENITFAYKGQSKKVFEDFSLTFEKNKIYGLLGKNGTGKSTLLYLMAGLLRPKSGTVTVSGMKATDRCPAMLSDLFIVTEEYDLPSVKLDTYVKTTAPFYPNFSREVLDQCLKDFQLEGNIKLNELSMGQKKKVVMSFALASGTSILLMDEPTNGLDIPSKSQFRKVIANYMTEDRTLIISTHQVHDIEQLLDHVVIVNENTLLMNSSVADICNEYKFEYRTPQEMADDVIYSEPTLQGNAVVAKRQENDEETGINLELLFNAMNKTK